MFDEAIKLVKKEKKSNELGDIVSIVSKKEVFAEVRSIGMKEKYEAMSVGLQPELTFVLVDYYDYDNEQQVEYNNILYDVIRTYRTGITLEVVVSRGNTE